MDTAAAAVTAVTVFLRVQVADKLVWSKVRDGMGGRVKVIVCGGSSLALHLEDFFDMIGQVMEHWKN
jgi:long-chain acyl-CoA synthetase